MALQNLLGDIALDASVQEVKTAVDAVTATINDGVAVTGDFYPATQPVSIAATVAVSGPVTDAQLRASAVPVSGSFYPATQPVSIAATVPVSASSLPLPAGAATQTTLASVDSRLAGTLAVNTGITQPLTNTELRATAVPVSAASLPLPTGAATQTTLASVDSRLAGTIAVSGPITDTQLRASAVPVSAAALPLPSGASTEATMEAIQNMSQDIRDLTDTILTLLSAIFEKMPRVTATDQVAASIENTPTVNIAASQTLATVSTLNNVAQIGGQEAVTVARSQIMSGATYIYDNVKVS